MRGEGREEGGGGARFTLVVVEVLAQTPYRVDIHLVVIERTLALTTPLVQHLSADHPLRGEEPLHDGVGACGKELRRQGWGLWRGGSPV